MPLTATVARAAPSLRSTSTSAALASVDAEDVQGLLASGYRELGECRYFLLKIRDARAARRWLAGLAPALGRGRSVASGSALTVAFTEPGLRALGLHERVLSGFSREFSEGLANEARSDLLGDVRSSSPALWRWGGPNNPPVHVLLGAFADTVPRLVGLLGHVHASLLPGGLSKLCEIETARPGAGSFRCADGSTPPLLADHRVGSPEPDPAALGELLLGYPDRHGRYAARPLLPAASDPMARLCLDRAGSPQHDLGCNGSYLVLRQLRQNPDAFQHARLSVLGGGADEGAGRYLALRSRAYGPPPNEAAGLDDNERGLCFLALNTDLSAQFELVQRWWLRDPRYAALFGELPPALLGQAHPARSLPVASLRRASPSSVDVVGGAYFFLPSLRALRYLAELSP